MAPTISFIIPVLNEAAILPALLEALRRDFASAQLIVVDGGSSDRSLQQALTRADQVLLGEPGRALQMNLGGQVASGEYLLFLHADSYPGFSLEQLLAQLADRPDWGFCPVRLSGRQAAFRVIEFFMNWRSRLTGVATGDQLLFLRRELFRELEGFAEIPLMEDVEFSKRLQRRAPPRILSQPVTSSSRRWEEGGIPGTVLRMWLLRLAYFLGVSPRRLWQHYYG